MYRTLHAGLVFFQEKLVHACLKSYFYLSFKIRRSSVPDKVRCDIQLAEQWIEIHATQKARLFQHLNLLLDFFPIRFCVAVAISLFLFIIDWMTTWPTRVYFNFGTICSHKQAVTNRSTFILHYLILVDIDAMMLSAPPGFSSFCSF